jgi:Ca-activated chloride channel family protein
MSFQSPLLLLALVLVPLSIAAYWVAQHRRRRYAVRFPGTVALAALVTPESQWRRHLPMALFAVALAALALALARPEATVAVPVERASVVLVTDVSRSMLATDIEPSRIQAAKKAADSFLERVPDGVNVGAVAFSGAPHTVKRPSHDHEEVRALVEGLTAFGATATGDALATALTLFEDRERKRRPPAAVILLSDGKTTTGRDPMEVAREAGRLRVPIYTVALGTEDGVLPDGAGSGIPVPPDPESLRRIAEASGGEAFAVEDAGELDTVYQRLGSKVGTKRERREITAGLAAGGFLLLVTAAVASVRSSARLP